MKRDVVYSEPCGCQVRFFALSEFHTSRMTPGSECKDHRQRDQASDRDALVQRARAYLAERMSELN